MHLTVRQNICDYIIQNRAIFKAIMDQSLLAESSKTF